MSNSQFCIQQRQKERQQLNKLLLLGFAGSAVLHGIFAYVLPRMSFESAQEEREPMELTLIDKPKPKPEPKVESKPIAKPEPASAPKPEPVQAKTPPPPPKAPEPVKAQTPPPKPEPVPEPAPAPKEVLTNPTPAPSQPIISAPVANTAQSDSMSSSLSAANSSAAASSSSSSSGSVNGKPGGTGSVVAANSAPPRPESNSEPEEGISCVSNCEPEYPTALDGVEGSAGVKLTIDPNGNVIGAELADADGSSSVNRQALLAARQMQFSSPGDSSASVQVKIDFTVEGSEYDRLAREEQEKKEQAAKERREQEAAARQQELEAQQAQQEQLQRERQAREQQEQQAAPPPTSEAEPAPKPLPALSPEELDEAMQRGLGGSPHERLHQEERLRKFRERMENYQEE